MELKNLSRVMSDKLGRKSVQEYKTLALQNEKSNPELAIYYYQQIIKEQAAKPDSNEYPGICADLAQVYYRQNNRSQAVKYYKKALSFDKQNPRAMKGIALAFFGMGVLSEAEYWFKKCLILNENEVDILYNLGTLYYTRGEYSQSIEYFQRAEKNAPDDVRICENLAMTYYALGDFKGTIETIQRSQTSGLESSQMLTLLGMAMEVKGEYDSALLNYRKAVEKDAGNGQAYLNLGRLFWRLGKFPDALENAELAQKIYIKQANKQSEALALWDTGWYHYCLGDLSRSVEASRKALGINPDLSPVWFNLGLALLHQGNPDEAFASYEKGIKSLSNLSKLKADAIDDLETALEKNPQLPGGAGILKYLYEQYTSENSNAPSSSVEPERYVDSSRIRSLSMTLLERYTQGLLDKELYNRAHQVLDSAQSGSQDDWTGKMSDYIEDFCRGKLSKLSLKVALDAAERQRMSQSALKK
jgi:tetratricopeptide (TPR) repeat protein